MDEFKHNLLHAVSAMILSMQEYEKKICDLIDKEYLKEEEKKREDDKRNSG